MRGPIRPLCRQADVQETGAGGAGGGGAAEGGGLSGSECRVLPWKRDRTEFPRADFTPAKPRLLQIVDPNSRAPRREEDKSAADRGGVHKSPRGGKPIDTMGMNFAPWGPRNKG